MPNPKLLFPVQVEIKIIDKEATTYNENAGEPVRRAKLATPTILIPAQPRYGNEDNPDLNREGVVEKTDGWLTMKTADLIRRGLFADDGNPGIKRGSKIIRIGKKTGLELFVTKYKPLGHYTSTNGYSLVRVYFEDRKGE